MDELNKGGGARLFRARYRPKDTDQPIGLEYGSVVVLKVVRSGGENPVAMDEITREAEILMMFEHRGLPRVLTRGMTAGRMWIAMDYVEGETVKTVFEAFQKAGYRMQPQVALALVADACEALAVAHGVLDPRGVNLSLIHRDLTPDNMLLDVNGLVHVFDFDCAVLAAREAQQGVVGTAGYMSPEQARGERLTQASDVYAMGIILFELVTGVRAFPVDLLDEMAVRESHANATRAPWPEGCDVSSRVRLIVDQCLHPDPNMRPDSGAALFQMISPMVRNQEEGRRRLALAASDLVRSNHERPTPLLVS
jgi:serine/threonine-protein kinase